MATRTHARIATMLRWQNISLCALLISRLSYIPVLFILTRISFVKKKQTIRTETAAVFLTRGCIAKDVMRRRMANPAHDDCIRS